MQTMQKALSTYLRQINPNSKIWSLWILRESRMKTSLNKENPNKKRKHQAHLIWQTSLKLQMMQTKENCHPNLW